MTDKATVHSLGELRAVVATNPGAAEFVDLANALCGDEATRPEAREVCLKGLSADPKNLKGRLLLAKLYYVDRMPEFCVRELIELKRYVTTPALERLLASFGDYLNQFSWERQVRKDVEPGGQSAHEIADTEDVLGEIELDADFDDALEEVE